MWGEYRGSYNLAINCHTILVQSTSLTSFKLMISFSSRNIFNEIPVNAFLEENTIHGSGICSFKYFPESLEIRFLTPFLCPSLTSAQFLVIEIEFSERLRYNLIRYNHFFCFLMWQIIGFLERGSLGILARWALWFNCQVKHYPSPSRTDGIPTGEQSRKPKPHYHWNLILTNFNGELSKTHCILSFLLKLIHWMQFLL